MTIMQLSETDLMAVSGGLTSQEAFREQMDELHRASPVGTVQYIDLGTTGGGRVDLGPKKEIVPVDRRSTQPVPPKGGKAKR